MSNRRTRFTNIVIVVVIVVLAPLLTIAAVWWQTGAMPQLFATAPQQIPPPNTIETVMLSVGETAETETQNEYSGEIALVIEGSLPSIEGGLRDVSYIHTDEIGVPLNTPRPAESLLSINGEPLALDNYNPFHIYEIQFDVGTSPQKITLSLDENRLAAETTRVIRVFIVQSE